MAVPRCFTDPSARDKVRSVCEQYKVDQKLLDDLCQLVEEYSGSGRAHGISDRIAEAIDAFLLRAEQEG